VSELDASACVCVCVCVYVSVRAYGIHVHSVHMLAFACRCVYECVCVCVRESVCVRVYARAFVEEFIRNDIPSHGFRDFRRERKCVCVWDVCAVSKMCMCARDASVDSNAHRHTDKHTERQRYMTHSHTDAQAHRHTGAQTEREIHSGT
jgi:hypothetical protein